MAPNIQNPLPKAADRWLIARRSDAQWKKRAVGLLVRLLGVDTTPKSDPAACAGAEQQCFDIIRRELAETAPAVTTHHAPIRREIAAHPYFTHPYYAGAATASKTDTVEAVYEGRGNLFAHWVAHPSAPADGWGPDDRTRKSVDQTRDGADRTRDDTGATDRHSIIEPPPSLVRGWATRPKLIFNGHMDTVAPFLPVRADGDIVHGRGAVDDKGPCLSMLLAAGLLSEIQREFGVEPACELLLQFVIDEEPGGNGSLSAALDVKPTPPDAVVVMECTGLTAYPANRGAVWFEVRLESDPGSDANLLEAMAFVVLQLESFGRKLKAESDHPLFPHRPVQTCHGRLGCYGQHPSRVQDYVALRLQWHGITMGDITAVVDRAVTEYCGRYGDKTKPGVGDAVLAQHIRWSDVVEDHATLEIFGLAGHMGAVDRLDGAITKASQIIDALMTRRRLSGGAWKSLKIDLAESSDANTLTLEGGQGFLPTHELDQVCDGIRQAVADGVLVYPKISGRRPDAVRATVTFEKLHNAAFARSPDGPAMTAMLEAGTETGLYHGAPVRGWDVSCDARIFAKEFPEAEIITFGPGLLAQAHGNDEQIDINDVLLAAETLARLALKYQR